jgi:S-adenosylmethionine hydrolase
VSIITLTTDFGTGSPYVAAIKGVILSINPLATIVDITHDIPPQDVRRGAVVLDDVAERFPDGTVHVVVVDPGVGTERALLFAQIGTQRYIAPDNGLLSRLARRTEPAQLIRLENDRYWLANVSATFHGRDIMAPAAAHLSRGLPPEELGPPAESLGHLDWPEVRVAAGRIEGSVLQIDSFGNLLTNIAADSLAGRPTDERTHVTIGGHETWGVFRTYGDQPQGTFIALVAASSNCMELAVVGGNAATMLRATIGDKVTVSWE